MVDIVLGSLGGEILVLVAIVLLLWVIYKLGKSLVKVILGIIVNSVLGVGVIFLVDGLFNLAIPLGQIYILVPLAIFGLPAAGTFIILRLCGVVLGIPA
jgi:hypothetical protein